MGGDYSLGCEVETIKPKPAKKLTFWRFLIGLLVFAFIVTRPVMRLTPEPPPEFFDARPSWSKEQKRAEEQLARVYWERAITVIQYRYSYGSGLPEKPPTEFEIDVRQAIGKVNVTPAPTERYWLRLRKVWGLPHSWRATYEFTTYYEWVTVWFTKVLKVIFG